MNRYALFLLVAASSFLVVSRARAVDGSTLLQQVLQALDDAPAYRMTSTTTKLDNGDTDVRMVEFVKPKAVHLRGESKGKVTNEMFSDGAKTYALIKSTGAFAELPKDIGDNLAEMAHLVTPMQELLSVTPSVNLVGHEEIAGKAISVYTREEEDVLKLHTTAKLWISEQDHRLLKIEAETHGNLKTKSHPEGRAISNRWTVSYEYDPSIKIVLPAK